MPGWISITLQIFQGLLTPVIGAVAVYIAWQQWQTNKQKSVLDRYDRRVYRYVVGFLTLVLRDFKVEAKDIVQFRSQTAEADFLFGPEILDYLDEVVKQALSLRLATLEYRDYTQIRPPGYDQKKVVAAMHEREVWFSEQHHIAKRKFKKYLDVSR
jgi:hypothetical protein